MIGLCIRYFNKNYGGMLQCYAFTRFFEKENIDYEIIRYKKKHSIFSIIKDFPRIFNGVLLNDKKEALKKKIGKALHKEFKSNDTIRSRYFEEFCNSHFLELSPIYKGYRALKEGSRRYTSIISGSDQLWSPAGLPTNFYNLQFCDKNVRRISYASSFGVGYIPWYQTKRTRSYLKKMDSISVRETKAAEIIYNLIGKEVPVVLDPVFLLTKDEWDKCIDNERIVDEEYVFAYFLGNTEKYRLEVSKFAKDKRLKIVTLKHVDQYVKEDVQFGDIELYNVGPKEFLNLIRNAKYVFTDSFHGSAFSIINRKQFMCFKRYSDSSKVSKNSRISSLMDILHIDCVYHDDIKKVDSIIDYEKVENILSELREKSISYLMSSIKDGEYNDN